MLKKTKLAALVAAVCTYQNMALAEETSQLEEISVVEIETSDTLVNTKVDRKDIYLRQAKDVKDLFFNKLDVNVSQLQTARSGGEGVNIRGLQGNRVTTTVDGIPLPEAQESKHFISYGVEFGRADYVDVSSLRSADVQYAGSANSLSGSVNFATLEPVDLLKDRTLGGFIGSGYNSADNSVYGTIGGAGKIGAYQGMVMTTIRNGDQTKNKGTNAGTGVNRTEPNPADTQNNYVLTKHYYQLNDQHRVGAAFEYQRKKIKTDLLTLNDTNIDRATGIQTKGNSIDRVKRSRFSLSHDYNNEHGWLQNAKTQVYYQNAGTDNYRHRLGTNNYRFEESKVNYKTYGINSNLMSFIDGNIPQVLRYGVSYNHTKATNYLHYERPAYGNSRHANFNGKPTSDTKQHKVTGYFEDEIAFGKWVVTPQVGFVHYRMTPSGSHSDVAQFQPAKRSETKFAPKLSLEYRAAPEFIPYVQYSRGIRTPSPQQLTSYFFESVNYFIPGLGPQTANVAVVGNPNLRSETADNFEIGVKGQNEKLQYLVTGYYNHYKNFIDWVSKPTQGYTTFIQYDNLDKAKVYGFTADVKWTFYDDFYLTKGISYSRGRATNNGVKTPINSIQPLKVKFGLGYEGDTYGANIQWTYNRGKSDKDIEQSSAYLYNPTGGYSLFDLGVYWKPVENLTLTANVNNLFNKKYWNWNDISYLALLSKATQDQGRDPLSIPLAITSGNADRYSAPGRNFNVGIRYEF